MGAGAPIGACWEGYAAHRPRPRPMNDPSAIEALATELRQLLGDDAVSTDESSLDKA